MNKFPDKLKIGGFEWEVILTTDISDDDFGTTNFTNQVIRIDSDVPKQKQEETLLHEILHICMWQTGLEHIIKQGDKISEEDIIMGMSMALYLVVKDNKLFIK